VTKVGRNDPCWCGSGKKFKKCHFGRETEKRLPFGAVSQTLKNSSRIKTCLHPEASTETCNNIISAHTLQKSRVLDAIKDSKNNVSTFTIKPDGGFKLQQLGWNKASTFTAFCGRHDDDTFADLEKSEYCGTAREIFLIAYRAVCLEVFQKRRVLKAQFPLRDLIDRGTSEQIQRIVQERAGSHYEGSKKGLEDLEYLKKEMDKALLADDLSEFLTCELAFTGPVSVVTTGAFSPNRLLKGVTIQVLHDTQTRIQGVAFGVDVRDKRPHVVFCCLKKDEAARAFIDELFFIPEVSLPEYIMQFFFAYCENTYFSQSWWESLNTKQQRYVRKLSGNPNPYYFPPEYDFDIGISPWKLETKKLL